MKNAIKKGCLGIVLCSAMFSCEELNDVLGDGDVVAGLKSALKVGIDTAANKLGQSGGYYNDIAVKIGMPSEVATTFSAVQTVAQNDYVNTLLEATNSSIPDEETFIQLFNTAAEDAAPKSVDIFVDAITDMTVEDGEAILFGADDAATTYLKTNTYTGLQSAFHPAITNSLNSVKVAGVTTTAAWSTFAEYNNKLASYMNSSVGKAAILLAQTSGKVPSTVISACNSVETVDEDLSDYITGKALDGLFTKVADKEYDIRYNVNARINDVLKKVFGKLDTQTAAS